MNAFKWLELILEEFGLSKKTPLCTNVLDQLMVICPDNITKEQMSIALNAWTTSDEYLKAIVDGSFTTHRYNLDGSEAERIKPHHRAYAKGVLDERKRQMDSRKRRFQNRKDGPRKVKTAFSRGRNNES